MNTEAEIADLRGRLAMQEVLMGQMLAHLCTQFANPVHLIAHIMDATETSLIRAQQAAPASQRLAADTALASYQNLSRHLLALVNRIAEPGGKG